MESDNRHKHDASNVATLGAGISITGDVHCETELQIAGKVTGDVHCPMLFLEEGGVVVGGIYAQRVRVSGVIDGSIQATDIAVESTARITGLVDYTRLKIVAGGVIEGTMKYTAEPIAANESANLKLVNAKEPINPRRVYVD